MAWTAIAAMTPVTKSPEKPIPNASARVNEAVLKAGIALGADRETDARDRKGCKRRPCHLPDRNRIVPGRSLGMVMAMQPFRAPPVYCRV
jgi:hypothetical protein